MLKVFWITGIRIAACSRSQKHGLDNNIIFIMVPQLRVKDTETNKLLQKKGLRKTKNNKQTKLHPMALLFIRIIDAQSPKKYING